MHPRLPVLPAVVVLAVVAVLVPLAAASPVPADAAGAGPAVRTLRVPSGSTALASGGGVSPATDAGAAPVPGGAPPDSGDRARAAGGPSADGTASRPGPGRTSVTPGLGPVTAMPGLGPVTAMPGPGPVTAARCGPELTSPDGVEAQTCVLIRGGETWARTYYRNATGRPLDAALALLAPGGRTVQMWCVVSADDEPASCETPREPTRGAPERYSAVTEFADPGADTPLLLRTGSNSAPDARS
ncbi:hypothetical protein [Streptomyces sp. bgisy153]|uniref:hypothetical protein n=1 Tax=Streptomyces sp. bgisy153 TaxID=3413793 RepID=UPI003D73D14F